MHHAESGPDGAIVAGAMPFELDHFMMKPCNRGKKKNGSWPCCSTRCPRA